MLEDFMGLIFPPSCAACGKLLVHERTGDLLCRQCLAGIEPVGSPVCTVCGIPFVSSAGQDHICGRCMKNRPCFHSSRSLFIYSGTVRKLIHRTKFHGDGYAMKALCRISARAMKTAELPQVDMIIPVPLHVSRLRARGFNQAASMAKRLFPAKTVNVDLLSRIRLTVPQMNLSASERHANVKGAFGVVHGQAGGKRLLVFDDIFTTGSTVDSAVQALERSGARRVDVFTLARTLRTGHQGSPQELLFGL